MNETASGVDGRRSETAELGRHRAASRKVRAVRYFQRCGGRTWRAVEGRGRAGGRRPRAAGDIEARRSVRTWSAR